MISKARLLFDTHAFLAFFNREEGSAAIKKIFDEVQSREAEGYVATITLTELAYIYRRKTDAATARLRVMQVQGSKLNLIPMSPEIAVDAGMLKRPGISVADVIIAATALSVGASVVTNDPHFTELGVGVMRYP
ncbi:PIN domain-containing protein [Methanoregula sp.]|uniref:PIN domain-containing protein n=1 Tax=Methanoregula sp. TaxID=2052170 RepID=UPI0023732010|nr:PIN domain-containing protein [Methanoregula sp.]MDD1687253.1 PIN domain-containing protein [Methanoregula sp.]